MCVGEKEKRSVGECAGDRGRDKLSLVSRDGVNLIA